LFKDHAMKIMLRAFAIGFAAGSVLMLAPQALHAALQMPGAGGDADRGAKTYEDNCTGCHSLDANRVGPAHRGVYGRKAGSAPGFAYSPGVKASKVIWREATINKWLTNPQAFIPGARMGFRLTDAAKRADVIAFLKRESRKK
jgi:cytochrome c